MKSYIPPSQEDLRKLQQELGLNNSQMADLAGVASESQWRKYTTGSKPRAMGFHMAFVIAARLTPSTDDVKIRRKMLDMGCKVRSNA